MHQNCIVSDAPQVVVDIMCTSEAVVVAAVANEFSVLEDDEVADVQMLMGRKTVTALEEKISGVVIPAAACIDVASTRADVRQPNFRHDVLGNRWISPQKILVGVRSNA